MFHYLSRGIKGDCCLLYKFPAVKMYLQRLLVINKVVQSQWKGYCHVGQATALRICIQGGDFEVTIQGY